MRVLLGAYLVALNTHTHTYSRVAQTRAQTTHHECDHLDWSGKFESEVVAGQRSTVAGQVIGSPFKTLNDVFECGKSGPTS